MNNETTNRSRSAKPCNGGGGQTLSPRDILVMLTIIALACVGGYFLLMKLIDVSRQEDCLLAAAGIAPRSRFRPAVDASRSSRGALEWPEVTSPDEFTSVSNPDGLPTTKQLNTSPFGYGGVGVLIDAHRDGTSGGPAVSSPPRTRDRP
jgi:hypothetical protein